VSYGKNVEERPRRAAAFVDKILRGAKPADLPTEQPSTYELVINLKSAKSLGAGLRHVQDLRVNQTLQRSLPFALSDSGRSSRLDKELV